MDLRQGGEQPADLRIVLIGKTGVGKSSTGNTILGANVFHKAVSASSVTKKCVSASNIFDGKKITVVDTPGLYDTDVTEAQIVEEIVRCIDTSYPGPHVFLMVVSIGRFTNEENQTVQKILDIFGEEASKYMMVLFTRGDDLDEVSIENYLKDAVDTLKNFVSKCKGGYHMFNNKDRNPQQVSALLQKIQDMVRQNGGGCYTNITYQLLEKYKKKEFELQEKIRITEKEMKIRQQEFQKMLKEQEKEKEKLQKRLTQTEVERATEEFLLVNLVQKLQVEERNWRESQQMAATSLVNQLATQLQTYEHEHELHLRKLQIEEQKQKAETQRHQLRMQKEELLRKAAEAKHKQKIEEEQHRMEKERLRMLQEHNEKLYDLTLQKQQIEAEKMAWLHKNVRNKSGCTVS